MKIRCLLLPVLLAASTAALAQTPAATYPVRNAPGNYGDLQTYRSDGLLDIGKAIRLNPRFAPFVVRKDFDSWWNSSTPIPKNAIHSDLADAGVDFTGSFVADFLGNVSGGQNLAFSYTHTLSGQLSFDLEKLVRWKGGTLTWSFADNAGSNLQNQVGNIFTPSNLYGPNTFYFGELYLSQSLFDGAVVMKLGQLCAADDFASSPIYGNYLNSAFNGNPFVPFGTYPMTGFPAASWGASIQGNWKCDAIANFYGQAGIYQVSDRIGIWGRTHHGMDMSIRPGDGTMIMWEAGWTPSFFANSGTQVPADGKSVDDKKAVVSSAANPGYPGHYKIGGFFSNWSYPTFSGAPNYPNAYGFYFLADQQVTMEPGNPSEGLVLWGTIGWTPQQNISSLPFFASGGAQYTGLLPGRSNDIALVGVAYGQGSINAIHASESAGLPGSTYEIAVEGTYVIQLNQWLSIQPDVQYIINPGGTGTIGNSWILGGQVTVNF